MATAGAEAASVAVVAVSMGEVSAEAVSVAVMAVSMGEVSAERPPRSVVHTDPLEWERAEAESASAYRATLQLERVRYIVGLSIIMDELADQ